MAGDGATGRLEGGGGGPGSGGRRRGRGGPQISAQKPRISPVRYVRSCPVAGRPCVRVRCRTELERGEAMSTKAVVTILVSVLLICVTALVAVSWVTDDSPGTSDPGYFCPAGRDC